MVRPGQIDKNLRHEILGISFLAAGLLGIVCIISPTVGTVAFYAEKAMRVLTGEGRYLFPLLMAFWGLKLIKGTKLGASNRTWGGSILFFVALTLLHVALSRGVAGREGVSGAGGGLLGATLYLLCYKSFGTAGTIIILTAFALIGFLLCVNAPLISITSSSFLGAKKYLQKMNGTLSNFLFIEEIEEKDENPVIIDNIGGAEDTNRPSANEHKGINTETVSGTAHGEVNPVLRLVRQGEFGLDSLSSSEDNTNPEDRSYGEYKLPPLTLLSRPLRNKNLRSNKDIAENVRILEETLENFGVKAKVTHVSRGPAITRYEIQPPPGIKVSRIVGLADDIALSMASPDVRIEAPIPGKAAVGIEVPNIEITMVHLRELLEAEEFRNANSRLTVVLGKDIAGNAIVADLTRMPHLLIAGATGSGKSVCLNTMLSGILFKAMPDHVKLLIIDPKMVELTTYNGIPHLISPVVTDPKKAATALRWAVKEMEYRYELFAAAGVRDITRYNNTGGKRDRVNPLPFIVVIIDELADLMMVAPADVEDSICRLAQMARAAGIHLVIATQRPSVDVITGLIKANIPSRVSFAVSSQVDSRTILDMGGAEKLLGKGDMLFFPVGAPKPIRVQGAYLSDREVESLVLFWKRQADPVYDENVTGEFHRVNPEDSLEDEMLPRAVEIFIETGHASISLLQRRLHIGYARAARLIDIMERRGIVGGYEGSKPRAVLMTLEQYESSFKEKAKKKVF